LALLGFEIKKSIASKEEVENAKLNQNNAPVESIKPTLVSKWKVLGGKDDQFDSWYAGQIEKGYGEQQMDVYLTKKLMAKKEEKGA
jgi:hypothetical protein